MPQHWRCPDCSALYGGWLSGCPRCRSEKELTLALNECAGCTTLFAVGLPRCPQCRSTDFAEQGQDMPKITAHGGATNAAEPGPDLTASTGAVIATSGAWADEPEPAEAEAATEPEPPEEESSPGTSSSTSSETPPSEPEPSETPRPKRARTTASRSKKAPTEEESSTAGSTDISGPETVADAE